MGTLQADDWVQATVSISDDEHKYARRGSMGRVIEVYPEGTLIYWERTRLITICFAREFERVSGPVALPIVGVLGNGAAEVVAVLNQAAEFVDARLCMDAEEAAKVRALGGTVWGVRQKGDTTPLPDVSEYIYDTGSPEDLRRSVRWKLRHVAPYLPPREAIDLGEQEPSRQGAKD